MRWVKVLLGLGMVLWGACSDNLAPELLSDSSFLTVTVQSSPLRKSQIEGVYLPDGAEIGLFLRASTGELYDSKSIDNIKCEATGSETEQTWAVDPLRPIALSRTKGVCYGYYPRVDGAVLHRVPITNDETDWMYTSAPATNLSNQHPSARLNMVHAMTIIRCKIQKGDYTEPGVVHTVSVRSNTLATSGIIDLTVPEVSSLTGTNTEIVKENLGVLDDTPLSVDFWGIPTGSPGTLFFNFKIDGHTYQVQSAPLNPLAGGVYNYTFTIARGELNISSVSVSNWTASEDLAYAPDFDDSDYAIDWSEAIKEDGVYAITADGRALAYEYALDSDYAGVALVILGKAYQIAKTLPLNSDGAVKHYFQKENYANIATLPNFETASLEVSAGFLPLPNGSYKPNDNKNYIDGDYQNWITKDYQRAALSDFNGKANTVEIMAAQTIDGVILENTCSKVLDDFNKNSAINEGHSDWFLPGLGQLGYLFMKKNEAEELACRLGGTYAGIVHMSSTQAGFYQGQSMYRIGFVDGFVCTNNKYVKQYAIRFFREI